MSPPAHADSLCFHSVLLSLLCSFANKQDGSSALSDQDLSDRLGLEQLFDSAGIDQCQVVGVNTQLTTTCRPPLCDSVICVRLLMPCSDITHGGAFSCLATLPMVVLSVA